MKGWLTASRWGLNLLPPIHPSHEITYYDGESMRKMCANCDSVAGFGDNGALAKRCPNVFRLWLR